MIKQLRTIPLLLIYVAIIYLSVKMPSGEPALFENIDKLYHFIAYGALGFAICISTDNRKGVWILLVISLTLGLTLEFVQGQLPYRDMSIADGVANSLGLISGTFAFNILKRLIVVGEQDEK